MPSRPLMLHAIVTADAARRPDRRYCMMISVKTRAVVLSGPGPVENLELKELPLPPERDGWVRIRVEAFGLNRSEYHTRLGFAEGVSFPASSASRPPEPSTGPRRTAAWRPDSRSSP